MDERNKLRVERDALRDRDRIDFEVIERLCARDRILAEIEKMRGEDYPLWTAEGLLAEARRRVESRQE